MKSASDNSLKFDAFMPQWGGDGETVIYFTTDPNISSMKLVLPEERFQPLISIDQIQRRHIYDDRCRSCDIVLGKRRLLFLDTLAAMIGI